VRIGAHDEEIRASVVDDHHQGITGGLAAERRPPVSATQ
jgi:hypothetical protein